MAARATLTIVPQAVDPQVVPRTDWWDGSDHERYWCEVTDRPDLGVDLKCPQTNEKGGEFWGYSLIRQVRPGDLVFHYKDEAIVGVSVVEGPLRDEPIRWRAQGTAARARPGPAVPRPGWLLPLRSFQKVHLALDEMREDEDWIRAWLEACPSAAKIPFAIQGGSLRGTQTYLAKLPAAFVAHWSQLAAAAKALGVPAVDEDTIPTADPDALSTRVTNLVRRARRKGRSVERPAGDQAPSRVETARVEFVRDPAVVAFVLARAAGVCELCQRQAPFVRDDGEPFLEVHHVKLLAHDGPDVVENAAALCPNCHRELHYGRDRVARVRLLLSRAPALREF